MVMSNSKSQRNKIRKLLEEAPIAHVSLDGRGHPGGAWGWVSVSDIMRLGIAQHGARILELRRELRREGKEIVNCAHWSDPDQRKHSDYAIMPVVEARLWWRQHGGRIPKGGGENGK